MRKGQKIVEHWKPTKYGYLRMHRPGTRTLVFVHVYVWEQHHGRRKPKGMDIHHKDEDKQNNHIDNLELLTRKEHKRLHCKLFSKRDGVWWKYCRECVTWKIADEGFYTTCRHSRFCKLCTSKRVVRERRERRKRRLEDGIRTADRNIVDNSGSRDIRNDSHHDHGCSPPGVTPGCDRRASG